MKSTVRHGAAPAALTLDASASLSLAMAQRPSDVLTLDELLAEPMVQQLMHRDRTDEATIRRLWQRMAAARPARTFGCMPPASQVKGDPDTIGRLLYETARLWRRRCERAMRAELPGMTCARCGVLVHLARPMGVDQVALAQRLDITPMTLVRLLDQLEADGFVARMPDPHDRRAHLLAPTTKALPVIACIYELARRTERKAQRGLSSAEANQLHGLLWRIRSNLTAEAKS